MERTADQQAQEKVWDLIKDIKVAQLVTHSADDGLHARPMVAQQDRFAGELWFFSWANSAKTREIKDDQNVLLAYSDPNQQNYVSLTGRAQVVRDREKIKELWSEAMRTWFPKGADDPDIALIRVRVESAEYWDSPSSTLVYAYGYAKAVLTGESPSPGENKVVDFKP